MFKFIKSLFASKPVVNPKEEVSTWPFPSAPFTDEKNIVKVPNKVTQKAIKESRSLTKPKTPAAKKPAVKAKTARTKNSKK